MAPFIEFIHVLCGLSFFGIMIASFIYVMSSIKQNEVQLLHYALKISLYGDILIFAMIVIQSITGTFMVHHHHLSFHTPWIIVAYSLFSVVFVLWLLLVLIKYVNYMSTLNTVFRYKKIFVIFNVLIILLFCMIVHDAVMQQTFLWR